MATKQRLGLYAPDGSKYGAPVLNGILSPVTTAKGPTKQNTGSQAPDGSIYFCLTDGANYRT